uniref:WD repeat domain 38 n=1 Tax=Myotis lucifugus TaxID=59463 RepID=G1Q0V3_MYOLU
MNSTAPGRLVIGRVKFFRRHRGEVNFSAFSPDGQTLLTASEDGCVYGWETRSGNLLWKLGGHTGGLLDLDREAKAAMTSNQRAWDWMTHTPSTLVPERQPLKKGLGLTHLRPRTWHCEASGLPSEAQGSHLQSGQVLRHLAGHQDSIQSSDFAPSSDYLATGSWDSTIRIWDLRTGTPAIFHQELEGHSGNVSCLCYSTSGLLASGSWDKTIHIWKPSTRSLLIQLKGHATWVKSIAFSPDGLQLASAGYSPMIKVWDCNTGMCIETLKQGALDVAYACTFTPDGKLLLVSGAVD